MNLSFLSYKVRQKDIDIEELAQFEKTRQGFGGAAPNKLEVQGVARSSAKCKSPGGAGAVSLLLIQHASVHYKN